MIKRAYRCLADIILPM